MSLPLSFSFHISFFLFSSPLFSFCFLSFYHSLFFSLTLGGVTIDKTDPSTVEALVGQTVVLPCRVSPLPSSTVVVEWRRDGIPLSTHRYVEKRTQWLNLHSSCFSVAIFIYIYLLITFRHHQQPNGSLLVGPVSKLDSGWFLCVATRERERDHRYIYLAVSGNYISATTSMVKTRLVGSLADNYISS